MTMTVRAKLLGLASFFAPMVLIAAGPVVEKSYTGPEILKRAEAVRNPDGAYGLETVITSSHPVHPDFVSKFLVYTNGRDRTLGYQTAPAEVAGRRMLIAAREVWLQFPGTAHPLRGFLRYVVTGEVASGDIARMNLAAYYEANLLNDGEVEGTRCYVLELRTRDPASSAYHRLLYWVAKRGYRPLKVEFYALSGRLMKTGWFGDYREALGVERPMRLTLEDVNGGGYRSIMTFGRFRRVRLPDAMFTAEALQSMVRPPEETARITDPGIVAAEGHGD